MIYSFPVIWTHANKQDHTKVVSLAPQKLKTYKSAIFERGREGQERHPDFHHVSAVKWHDALAHDPLRAMVTPSRNGQLTNLQELSRLKESIT